MSEAVDYRLYLVTDRDMLGGRSLPDVVRLAVKGGVTIVQLREKACSTREYVDLAREIKRILTSHHVPLIINDRLDVALAAGADGVHIGQSDMPYAEARRIMGPEAIIGLTVESEEQARLAESLDADYLGVSTIFPTPTKTDTVYTWGIGGLQRLSRRKRHPLVAIGGLHEGNAADIIRAGADGIAVVSAVCAAADPEAAARGLRRIIDASCRRENRR
jgi:thiamine-phosphate pyrophosphorylase